MECLVAVYLGFVAWSRNRGGAAIAVLVAIEAVGELAVAQESGFGVWVFVADEVFQGHCLVFGIF